MMGKIAGRISIGAVNTSKYSAPFTISEFSKLYPNVGVKLSTSNQQPATSNQQEIGNALSGDNLDFPIMGRPPDIDMEELDRWDHRNLAACRPSRSLPLEEDEPIGPYSSRI